jgi:hypothetical protein
MRPPDVRDVEGRLWRLFWSVLAGAMLAVVIAAILPQRSSSGWGGGAFDLTNPLLVAAGAVGIAIGVYALLGVFVRTQVYARLMPPVQCVWIPRARLLASRGNATHLTLTLT